jgi:hypothetical protein
MAATVRKHLLLEKNLRITMNEIVKPAISLSPSWRSVSSTCSVAGSVSSMAVTSEGVALLTGVQARLAAIVVSAMLASFGLMVNEPLLLADHSSNWNWTESAVNLAGTAAWVVADSLARPSDGASELHAKGANA